MLMKKQLSLLLAFVLLFTLAACGNQAALDMPSSTAESAEPLTEPTATAPSTPTETQNTNNAESTPAETMNPNDLRPQATATPAETADNNNADNPSEHMGEYIGNRNSKKFHRPKCHSLPAEKNRVYLSNRTEAIESGYTPCGKRCP